MKKIIITGCSGSIGNYLSNYFKKKKYKVIGIDKVAPKMKGIDFYNADMSNYTKLKKVYKKISRKYKNVNVLVNSAGFIHNELLIDLKSNFKTHSFNSWRNVFKNNLDITFLNSMFFIDFNCKNYFDEKLIINFISVNSDGVVGQSAYSSSKAAIEIFTKVLALELASFKFRTACISPGYINVDSTIKNIKKVKLDKIIQSIPLKKMGTPNDVAKGIDYVINNKYFNGKVLKIDGGK